MKSYSFDTAISFHSEDLNIALCLYLALKLHIPESRNFLYTERVEQCGTDLYDTLPDIYARKSRLVISIISSQYGKTAYSRLELNTVLARIQATSEEISWIPILVGNARLSEIDPTLKDSIACLKWESNPEDLATKIGTLLNKPTNVKTHSVDGSSIMNAQKIQNSVVLNNTTIKGNITQKNR